MKVSRVITQEDIDQEVEKLSATNDIKEILETYHRLTKYGRIKALLTVIDELSKEVNDE